MKKITATEMLTLDGYFGGINGETEWFMWDKDTDRETFELLSETDCLLLGHETYKLLSSYWPDATEEDPEYINRINSLKKVVVSKNKQSLDWNAEVLAVQSERELIESAAVLKREYNMLIIGSGSIVSILTKHRLIDTYRLFINPVILGSGKPLFHNTGDKTILNAASSKTFENGVVLLEYQLQGSL